jgi:NTE family protein
MVDGVNLNSANVVQDAAAFQWDGGKLEAGIGIALSGDGFRAMLFHAGALARMNFWRGRNAYQAFPPDRS